MKRTFCAIAAIAGLLFATTLHAQEQTGGEPAKKKKKHTSISISNKGIRMEKTDSAKGSTVGKLATKEEENRFTTSIAMVDLGINMIEDNTNYSDPAVQSYLNVPVGNRNTTLFDLKANKSVNVNIYPWMVKFAAVKTHGQRIYISSGLGLQLYNFRYENNISYTRSPAGVIMDTVSFTKNKLGLDYLNLPLMVTFKTRLFKDRWLVYGAGITEGFRIASWTKQKSSQRGKVKIHDDFELADFNTCLTAEFGIEGILRFYASYQLTSLYEKGLDQHPFCFGFRFSGI
ncbi:MAG: hypothetical protein V4649_11255 [Bacteroidota bacterium]